MIVLNVTKSDIGFRDSPMIHAFFRTYGNRLQGWRMTIGRDYGYLYNQTGYTYQFNLSQDAWGYNLMWHRNKTSNPDPALILTMKDIVAAVTGDRYGASNNAKIPIRIGHESVVQSSI